MSHIPPLAASILQTGVVQHQRSAERARQTIEQQPAQKGINRQDDTLELEVEDSDELHTIDEREQPGEKKQKKKEKPPEEQPPRLDLTA